MKGRISAWRQKHPAIEAATGIDLIIDDTPKLLFYPALIRLEGSGQNFTGEIDSGWTNSSGRIEEIVKKVRGEVDQIIRETGEKASFWCWVHDIHPDHHFVGSLKYRTSYSQNVLQHSMDVSYLAGIMAAELKLNVRKPGAQDYCMISARQSTTK